jgi:hypothetical protein
MGQRSWDFVDRKVRGEDVVRFFLVALYLGVVCCYLILRRRLHSGLNVASVKRKLGGWLRPAGARAGRILRFLRLRRGGDQQQRAA